MRTSLAASTPGPDRDSPRIGERFANRYKLLARVRGEGIAHVYLAQDGLGREVGLLTVDAARCDPRDWGVFTDVVAFASAAQIPGLALFHGLSAAPAPPYCLAHAPGRTLERLLRDEGPVPWPRALALGERLAAILEAVESTLGIAHRALTPGRCVLTSDSDLQILDYGIAELEPFACPDDATHRAPEQRRGPGDHRSDVYSLAAILFELVTGERPSGKLAPRLRSSVRDAPQHVDDLFARALAPDPEDRHPDLATLRAALHEALERASPAASVTATASPQPVAPAPAIARPAPASIPAAAAAYEGRTGPAPSGAPGPRPAGFTPTPVLDTRPRPVAATTAPIPDPGLRPATAPIVEPGLRPATAPIPDPGLRPATAPIVDPGLRPAASSAPVGDAGPRSVAAPVREPDRVPAFAVDPRFAPTTAPAPVRGPDRAFVDPRLAPVAPASASILDARSAAVVAPASAPIRAPRPDPSAAPAFATLRQPSPAVARPASRIAAASPAPTEILPPVSPREPPVRKDILPAAGFAFPGPLPGEPPARDGKTLIDPPNLRARSREAPKPAATVLLPETPVAGAQPFRGAALASLRDREAPKPAPTELLPHPPVAGSAVLSSLRAPAEPFAQPQFRPGAPLANHHTPAEPAATPQQRQRASVSAAPRNPAPAEPALLEPRPPSARSAARPAGEVASSPRMAAARAPDATSAPDPRETARAPDRRLLIAAVVVINLSLALVVLFLFMR